MPIDSQVTTQDTGGGTQANGSVTDTPGPGSRPPYMAEVIMIIDPTHVRWDGTVHPNPHKVITIGPNGIKFWWRERIVPGPNPVTKRFRVGLVCKPNASGPTAIGLTVCTEAGTPPQRQFFNGATWIIWHGSHRCYRAHGLRARPRKRLSRKAKARR